MTFYYEKTTDFFIVFCYGSLNGQSMFMETVIFYNGKVFVGLVEGSDEGERNYGIIFIFPI